MDNNFSENGASIYQVDAYNDIKGLVKVESEWQKIITRCPDVSFYHRYEWYHAYMRHLELEPEKVYFFLVKKNNNPICIIPLKYMPLNSYAINMQVWVTPRTSEIDLYDFVSVDRKSVEESFCALIAKLRSYVGWKFDAIILDHLLDGGNASTLTTAKSINKLTILDRYSKTMVCKKGEDVASSWGSGKFRRNLRRLEKRLSSRGSLAWEYIDNPVENQEAFQEFLDVESSGWKGVSGTKTAIKSDENVARFYQELLEKYGALGKCRINLLKIDGKTIAGQYCLLDDKRINLLKIGFDQDYKETSPGFLLIKNVFENTCNVEKFSEMSFVTGADWNDSFKPKVMDVHAVTIFNSTLKGSCFSFIENSKQKLRKYIESMKGWRV